MLMKGANEMGQLPERGSNTIFSMACISVTTIMESQIQCYLENNSLSVKGKSSHTCAMWVVTE